MEEDTGVQTKQNILLHDLMAKGKALCLDVIEELHKKGRVHPG